MFKLQPKTGIPRIDKLLELEHYKVRNRESDIASRQRRHRGDELKFIQLPIYRYGVDPILESRYRVVDAYPYELMEGRSLEETAWVARWISYPAFDDYTRRFIEMLRDVSSEGRDLFDLNQDPTRRRAFIHKPTRVRL